MAGHPGPAGLAAWRKRRAEEKVAAAAEAERYSQMGMTKGQMIDPKILDKKAAELNAEREARLAPHRWKPGQSGNPAGGRQLSGEAREILAAATPHAARRLVEMMDSDDEKIRLQAIEVAWNRLYGRPTQVVDAQVTTTNVQQAHLQILLELQAKAGGKDQVIEGDAQTVMVHGDAEPGE